MSSSYLLMASLAVVALDIGPQVATPQSDAATSIERALIERACGTPYTPWADEDAQQCFGAHLLALRTDFGRDLSKLANADRKAMDVACRGLRRPEQQDAYIDCLAGQLATLHDRRHHQPAVARDAAVAASAATAAPAEEIPAGRPTSSWRRTAIVGVSVTSVIGLAGLGFLAMRPRRTLRKCRVCGVEAPGADLCATCRHEAAEAVKRDAAERIQNERTQEEKLRPEPVPAVEQHEISGLPHLGPLVAPVAEDHAAESAHARADAQLDDPSHDRVEGAGHIFDETAPEVAAEPVFDPYVVLGVPAGASADAIGTAYELARKRYDPEQVSFLGYEAQESFRLKAESVERAFLMLSSSS